LNQETYRISIINIRQLLLFGEISVTYRWNHTKHTNILREENTDFNVMKQVVHIVTAAKISRSHGILPKEQNIL
jgi:hypothetical protein